VEGESATRQVDKKEGGMTSISVLGILGIALTSCSGQGAIAQASGLQRTVLQREDISGGREAVMARVEIAPNVNAGMHTHPGEEMAYVMEGEGELLVEGQATRTVRAGDSFVVPSGLKHDVHNIGNKPFKVVAVYLVEKGRPLATPAP
jgi:quercetin dioxygenase-like cupin family protein